MEAEEKKNTIKKYETIAISSIIIHVTLSHPSEYLTFQDKLREQLYLLEIAWLQVTQKQKTVA